jgi:hypothetical protein
MNGQFALTADLKWLFFAIAFPLAALVTTAGLTYKRSASNRRPAPQADPFDSTMLAREGTSY